MIGLVITLFAGCCFSLFSPAFNLATNDQWNTMKSGVPHLVVYTAYFYFSLSSFTVAMVLNIIFLYRPILKSPKSSMAKYLNDWNGRYWAFFAGILCGLGNGLQFMGGQAAGYAAADAVQVSFHFAFCISIFYILEVCQSFHIFIFLAKKTQFQPREFG